MKLEYRERSVFTLTEQGDNEAGLLIVQFEAIHPADSLFTGTAYIDTSAWFPVRVEMSPSKLPSELEKMEMVAHFAPDEMERTVRTR